MRGRPGKAPPPWPLTALRMASALIGVAAVSLGCGVPRAPAPDVGASPLDTPPLELRPLAPGVWLHTSWQVLPGVGPFPSNGLVVEDGEGLLLVDSAWGDEATLLLLQRLERELGKPVTRVVATHHHEDRLSGGRLFAERDVPVLGHPLTLELAVDAGLVPPRALEALREPGAVQRLGPVELFYPGAGHAADNLMVWVPSAGVLFGGCAVRAADTGSLGNVADADLTSWPRAIERARTRYGSARMVVPGHGAEGVVALLDHTLRLLEGTAPPR